jgi:hypothetical protein
MAIERQRSWITSNVAARVLIALSLAFGAMIAAVPITNLIGVRDLYGLVAAVVRLIIGRRYSETLVAGQLIALLCVLAAGVYFFTPALPE